MVVRASPCISQKPHRQECLCKSDGPGMIPEGRDTCQSKGETGRHFAAMQGIEIFHGCVAPKAASHGGLVSCLQREGQAPPLQGALALNLWRSFVVIANCLAAGVTLLFPGVAVGVVAVAFPETKAVVVEELEAADPFDAFPGVQMRDDEA
jgi:hypothetical protein